MIHNSNFQSFYFIELCPVFVDTAKCLFFHIARFFFSQKSSLPIFVTYPLAWNSILQSLHFMLCLLKGPYQPRENQKSFLQLLFESWSMVSNIFEFSSFNTFLSTYNRIPSKSQVCGISRYEVNMYNFLKEISFIQSSL